MYNKKVVFATIILVLLLGMFAIAQPAPAASVTPVAVNGNPSCADLGYKYGFKPQPEPPPSGTYPFPDGINEVTITSNGIYFDWSASLGIDAVIVKGGKEGANVYTYSPEADADEELTTPTGQEISHIEFCYDYELDATKTANTEWFKKYEWTITKSVDQDSHTGFTGDSFTSNYTVAVDQTVTEYGHRIYGDIVINNPTPFSVDFTVGDVVDGVGAASVTCPSYNIAASGTVTCTYEVGPGGTLGTLNTATVTSQNPDVGGDVATADVIWGDPTIEGYHTINVTDTNGESWQFSASGSKNYKRTFTCDGDEGKHDNTATITETGQSDDASVTVNCYALEVTKDANTSFTRTWDWTIDKSADQSELILSPGQKYLVNYTVEVDASFTDSDWAVSGKIWIKNPHPSKAATLTAVSDLVSPNIAATVDCPSLTVPAGGTLECTYSADLLPDASSRTNTATATLQNYSYDSEGNATASGTSDFSSNLVNFDFTEATINKVDECIDVSDTNIGFLGTICAEDAPKTFTYSLWFGQHPDADIYLECGPNTHTNTASFAANDSGATDDSTWTVNANVNCDQGCTLTQGYWKTHSSYGPAPYDDTWEQLLNGASTPFFDTGKTWYEVLWTPPSGNAYYNLAHQYIAAYLNVLNGADPSAIAADLTTAAGLLDQYDTNMGAIKGGVRNQFLTLANKLDQYNNGLIGPGHCSE